MRATSPTRRGSASTSATPSSSSHQTSAPTPSRRSPRRARRGRSARHRRRDLRRAAARVCQWSSTISSSSTGCNGRRSIRLHASSSRSCAAASARAASRSRRAPRCGGALARRRGVRPGVRRAAARGAHRSSRARSAPRRRALEGDARAVNPLRALAREPSAVALADAPRTSRRHATSARGDSRDKDGGGWSSGVDAAARRAATHVGHKMPPRPRPPCAGYASAATSRRRRRAVPSTWHDVSLLDGSVEAELTATRRSAEAASEREAERSCDNLRPRHRTSMQVVRSHVSSSSWSQRETRAYLSARARKKCDHRAPSPRFCVRSRTRRSPPAAGEQLNDSRCAPAGARRRSSSVGERASPFASLASARCIAMPTAASSWRRGRRRGRRARGRLRCRARRRCSRGTRRRSDSARTGARPSCRRRARWCPSRTRRPTRARRRGGAGGARG